MIRKLLKKLLGAKDEKLASQLHKELKLKKLKEKLSKECGCG
jgi:hypothetical protein